MADCFRSLQSDDDRKIHMYVAVRKDDVPLIEILGFIPWELVGSTRCLELFTSQRAAFERVCSDEPWLGANDPTVEHVLLRMGIAEHILMFATWFRAGPREEGWRYCCADPFLVFMFDAAWLEYECEEGALRLTAVH